LAAEQQAGQKKRTTVVERYRSKYPHLALGQSQDLLLIIIIIIIIIIIFIFIFF